MAPAQLQDEELGLERLEELTLRTVEAQGQAQAGPQAQQLDVLQ